MKTHIKILIIFFIITLMTEVFIFNFRFFESLGYESTPLEISSIGSGLQPKGNGIYTFKGGEGSYISVLNIDKPVNNLYISISSNVPYKQLITISATDEGNKLYFKLPQREIVSTVERSKYIKMNTSGRVEKLLINFDAEPLYNIDLTEAGTSKVVYEISIDEITANKPVPFFFEPIRFAFVFALLLLLYALRYNSGLFKYELNFGSPNQRMVIIVIIALNILFAMFIYTNNLFYFHHDRGVYTNLAQSLMDGRFDLPMLKTSGELVRLANPYDTYYRDLMVGSKYAWDYAYFNGRYYVYFGIVPCLMLFLPIKLLFNYDLPVNLATHYFVMIYIIVGFRFIYTFCKKLFKSTSCLMYLMAAELFVFCGGVSFAVQRNDLYPLPSIAALIFTALGLDLWFCSVGNDGNIKSRVRLLFGSLCMALVAGCRPQLVLGSFFAIPLFWNTVFKKRQLFALKNKGILDTLLFVLPYAVVAAGLMYYNYARFGSVTDFGAMYNLTTNDMTKRGFRLDRIPYGIWAYLIQPLNISARFPFLEHCPATTSYMGVTIIENMRGGLLSLTPVIWFNLLVFSKRVREMLRNKGLLMLVLLCSASGFIILLADANMSGLVLRYFMDFSWLFILSAFAIAMCIMENATAENAKTIRCLFSLGFLASMVFNILLVFARYRYMSMDASNPDVFYSIMYAIQFWM